MLSTEHLGIEESIAFCGDGLRIGLSSDLDALVVDERYMFRYERVIKRVQVERREGHRDVRGGERGRHLGRRRQQRAGRLQESLCLPMFGHSLPVSAFAPTGPRVSHPLAASIGPSGVGICHPSPRVSPHHVCSELPHMHTGSPCSPPGDHTESYSRGAPAILAPDGARIRPQMVLSVTEQRIRGCSISLVQPHHNGAVSLPGYQAERWPAASLAEVRIRPMGRKKTVDDNPLIRFSAAVLPFASGRSLNLRHPVSSLYCLCSFISPIGSERAWS